MNLVVPVNLQALRVSPNDASLITKKPEFFSGPTASFEELPWRDSSYTDHPGRVSKANLSVNVANPLSGGVTQQLDAGIHLHWALPDGLTRGVQQPDGSLVFPAVPNRWLVTRILQQGGQYRTKQWIVESDHLMTEEEYTTIYYPATRRKAAAIPSGWTLIDGNNPQQDGGALYHPPSRRLGRVFELAAWQPTVTPAGAPADQVRHLDELKRQATAFAQPLPPGPLTAVGATGPTFAAYYPDSRSAFGFHDLLDDLGGGFDLKNVAFQASYLLVGWHSHAADDPLRSALFSQALTQAEAANAQAPAEEHLDTPHLRAGTVLDTYRWHYDPAAGTPDRCLYSGQLAGLTWDTTGNRPGTNPQYPKCYLQPPAADPSVRLAVGASTSSALSALIKHDWESSPGGEQDPDPDDQSARDLELLLDALQLGLLHGLGTSTTLAQVEQGLHQSGFGALQGGHQWTVEPKATASDKSDPQRFAAPGAPMPEDGDDIAGKLATLNACQTRLDALLGTLDSGRRQTFLDWYHYITVVGSGQADNTANTLKESLKTYISGQIIDLWAKLDAAFGLRTAPGPATGNLPIFFSNGGTYLVQQENGRYTSPSPLPSLAGQIAAAANAVLDVLAKPAYAAFELRRVERPRFWLPNEPVVVATGDGLRPARRNGIARNLPCRLPRQLLRTLNAKAGSASADASGNSVAAALTLTVPDLSASRVPEAEDTRPLLADIMTLLGEACLLDPTLAPLVAPLVAGTLTSLTGPTLVANLETALRTVTGTIAQAWQAGGSEAAPPDYPGIVTDPSATAGTLTITLPGQAPQGAGVTTPAGWSAWEDPFLPLYLVWEVHYRPFEKGSTVGAPSYGTGFVTGAYELDENGVDLVLKGAPPATQGGAAALRNFIPLSSRASEPLLDQIRQYLATYPDENTDLHQVIDYLRGKPLLSQALNGFNLALMSRAQGMQIVVFNPFYDIEPPATRLGTGTDTLDHTNVLTHFVGWAAPPLTDQVPLGEAGFNPLQGGYLTVVRVDVVDTFGRKRRAIDGNSAADAGKVVVASALQPPPGVDVQAALPPRLAQPARLLFEWVSGNDGRLVTSTAPSTSPVTGWVVFNHLDNSLMLFAPSGRPLGALGVFGGQTTVAWQSPPGNPAQPMETDLAGPELAHFRKFATFIHGRSRAFFTALTTSIENAHTYILADAGGGEPPYAVLMGRPLALVRAELRLEMTGEPAFDTGLASVNAAMSANGSGPYDWTRRADAGMRNVDFPVRLGDMNHLSDGLVAYLIDGPAPYSTLYAPAAPPTGVPEVQRPAPDTLCLKLRPALDPPATPWPTSAAQTAALQDATARSVRTAVTLLIDPRASVHAVTGILPTKDISLPSETYAKALQSIEVTFFTHPVLRSAQGLELPVPEEGGFSWHWTTGVKADGTTRPHDENLPPPLTGDRAHFRFSPQTAEDGWLKLVPKPPQT